MNEMKDSVYADMEDSEKQRAHESGLRIKVSLFFACMYACIAFLIALRSAPLTLRSTGLASDRNSTSQIVSRT